MRRTEASNPAWPIYLLGFIASVPVMTGAYLAACGTPSSNPGSVLISHTGVSSDPSAGGGSGTADPNALANANGTTDPNAGTSAEANPGMTAGTSAEASAGANATTAAGTGTNAGTTADATKKACNSVDDAETDGPDDPNAPDDPDTGADTDDDCETDGTTAGNAQNPTM